eukprot:556849-Pleurochrysis_carterae.AAC.1
MAFLAAAARQCCRSPPRPLLVLFQVLERLVADHLLCVHAATLPLLLELLCLVADLLHLLLARHDCLDHLITEDRRRRLTNGENLTSLVVVPRGDIELAIASASLPVLRLRLPGGYREHSHKLEDVIHFRDVGAESQD